MVSTIEFFIDDKPYSTRKATKTVAEILALASLSAEEYFLISPNGIKYADPKQNVEIHSGDHFKTEKRDRDSKPQIPVKIHYQVNGEPQTTTDATLSVEQILRNAGKEASIDLNQLSSYILENIKTGDKFVNLSDSVTILNNDEFLAVHSGATPVA